MLREQRKEGDLLAGRFRLTGRLGSGGMCDVHEAMDELLGRRVAIKLLHEHLIDDEQIRERFHAEADALGGIEHPNVIRIYDVGEADGVPYLVLELLEGESLGARLRKGPMDLSEARDVLVPIANGLAAAHDAGIVHRDLKPDNVFLARDPSGRLVPKVLDFGVAKHLRGQQTQAGTVLGTPLYMAPEQVSGRHRIGAWSDVWALGIVSYRILAHAAIPYAGHEGASPRMMIHAVLEAKTIPLLQQNPHVPPGLAEVIERCLQPDPRSRYQEIGELAGALGLAFSDALHDEVSVSEPVAADLLSAFADSDRHAPPAVVVLGQPHERDKGARPRARKTSYVMRGDGEKVDDPQKTLEAC